MILFLCVLLFLGGEVQAQIFIRSSDLSSQDFEEIVEARQGTRFSDWWLEHNNTGEVLPLIHSLGTDYIQNKIDFKKFKTDLAELIGNRFLTLETRYLFLEIYGKKINSSQLTSTERKILIETSCHLLQLENHWQSGYLLQKKGCSFSYKKKMISNFLRPNERVFIEGVELKEENFFLTYAANWSYHWHILTDNSEAVFFKGSVDEFLRHRAALKPLVQGSCSRQLVDQKAFDKIGLPPLNTYLAFDRNCFPALAMAPIESSSNWKKPALIFLSLVAVSIGYSYFKNHELVLEF